MTLHPPKPRLALSVGIVGHRPNRLPAGAWAEVAAGINEALTLVSAAAQTAWVRNREFFTEEPPALTLVSALAEGADRIAACAALENGYSLTAVLPFDSEEYERDFNEASSISEYEGLLEKADRTVALPGNRAPEAFAYETAGLTILGNVEILLAVWDGGASAGRGGTTDLVERAAQDGLPVIHVDAAGKKPPRLLWFGLAEFACAGGGACNLPSADLASALPGIIENLVRPPSDQAETAELSRYLRETWKPRNWRPEVPLLLALLGLRLLRKTDFKPTEPAALAVVFHSSAIFPPPKVTEPTPVDALSPATLAFGWADALAIRYAQIFRGAYISNFLFSAFAVFAAATSLVGTRLFDWPGWPLALLEIAFVVFVFVNTYLGRKRDWHNRWRQSREVAERLRAIQPLRMLAQDSGASRAGEATWTAWYVRAQMRALGLSAGALNEARLEEIRQTLISIVDSQGAYHTHVAALMRGVEHRIKRLGQGLFGFTIIFAAVKIVTALSGFDLPVNWQYVLTGLTAALPALGAATFGVRLIGDFEGVAQRSERTGAALTNLANALRQDPPELTILRSRARLIADAMLGDVSHWRMTTETRKLVVPA